MEGLKEECADGTSYAAARGAHALPAACVAEDEYGEDEARAHGFSEMKDDADSGEKGKDEEDESV